MLDEIDSLRQGGRQGKKANGAYDSDSEMSMSELSETKGHGKQQQQQAQPQQKGPAKKKRDPNAPKGPGNVFFVYCRMERDKIKDQVPNENLGEITRLLGQKWKTLPKEEKKKYYDIYNKEVDDYEVAMKSYIAAGGGVEGAAAVEAAAALIKKQDEEEIDMLDDDDEEDEEEIIEEDEDEEEHKSPKLKFPQSVVSPPSSVATDPLPETPQNTNTPL